MEQIGPMELGTMLIWKQLWDMFLKVGAIFKVTGVVGKIVSFIKSFRLRMEGSMAVKTCAAI
jgi:hypothetical protein